MSRRTLERLGLLVGLAALLAVLGSATLIDRRPPAVERISLSRPAGDDRLALTHAAIDVRFSEPVQRRSAETRLRILPVVAGTLSWDGDRTLIFTPASKLPLGGSFSVRVEAGVTDLNGNVSTEPSPPFGFRTIDQPAITATTPLDGADAVGLEGPISITFDRLMDTELTGRSVRFDPPAPVRASWAGPTLTVTPRTPLKPATRYRLTVDDPAADTDGNQLGRPLELSFTTVRTGLAARQRYPADGSAGTLPTGPVAVIFDGPVDPAVPGDAIRLTPAAAGNVRLIPLPSDERPAAGTANASPAAQPATAGTVVVFEPSGALAPHTTYTVELRAGAIRGLGSTEVAPQQSWSFTTGSTVDVVQNQILFLSARTGIRNVWAMNPDGTNPRQLTGELAPVTSYDVAGDGRRLVYASAGRVRLLALPEGTVRTLTDEANAEYGPRLTPDGSAVVVGRRDRATGIDEGTWRLPLRDEAGPPRQIMPGGAPALGSTGATTEELALAGAAGPWAGTTELGAGGSLALVIAADGSLVRVDLATGAGAVTGLRSPAGPAVWSPALDAFVVVATRERDSRRGSWLIPARGAPLVGPPFAAWATVSARGALAGLSGEGAERLEYRRGLQGAGVSLTNATDLIDREPTFAPTGEAVVFVRASADAPGRSRGIWLVGVDGRELRQLSTDGSSPRWLP